MKKAQKLYFLSFLVFATNPLSTLAKPTVSQGINWTKSIALSALGTITINGLYFEYRHFMKPDSETMDPDSETMDPEQERVTRAYIKKISPDFSDSCSIRARWSTPEAIVLRRLPFSNILGSHNSITKIISLRSDIRVDSLWDRYTGTNRIVVAHELAHYKHHGLLSILNKILLLGHKLERLEIEADFEAMKMLEKHDMDALKKYLLFCQVTCLLSLRSDEYLARPDQYLTEKETLFIWDWYKKEREKKQFNQGAFLDQYLENRCLIQSLLRKFPSSYKEITIGRTETTLRKLKRLNPNIMLPNEDPEKIS